MSTQWRAFRPLALTQNIAVTAAAQTQTFNYSLGTFAVRFVNIGTQTVFVLLRSSGDTTAATTSNAMPIAVGDTAIFTCHVGTVDFSVIAGDVGSTLYSTVGEGL